MHVRLISVLVACSLVVGCGGGDDDESSTIGGAFAAAMGDAVQEAAAEEAAAREAEAAAPLALVSHALASADPRWAGWTADAPEDARVMQEGAHGARLASNGADGWDLSFVPRHRDLTRLRSNLEGSASAEITREFLVDEGGRLEWTSTGYGHTTYNFVHNIEVDGQEISCANNYMIGIGTEARFMQHKEACGTLHRGDDG